MLTKYKTTSIDRLFENMMKGRSNLFDLNQTEGEWLDKSDSFEYRLEVPGYSTSEINVELKESTLMVTGKREKKSEFSSESQSFKVTESIPQNVDSNAVEAIHENGVLYLKFPKKELHENKVKQVTVKSGKSV